MSPSCNNGANAGTTWCQCVSTFLVAMGLCGCETLTVDTSPYTPHLMKMYHDQHMHAVGRVLPAELDLQTAKEIALKGNPGLLAVQARTAAATARRKQALSGYYPQVGFRFSAEHVHDVPRDQTFGSDSVSGENYFLGATSSLALFDGFLRNYAIAAAKYDEVAATYAHADAQRLLVRAVAAAYYGSLLSQHHIQIAEADMAFNKRFFDETQLKYEAGTASRADVLNFQLRVETARAAQLTATREYRASLISVAALLGLAYTPDMLTARLVDRAEPDSTLDRMSLKEGLETAVAARPDMKQMLADLEKRRADAGVELAGMFPRLDAVADMWAFRRDELRYAGDDLGLSYGAEVSWDAFAGGRKIERWREKKHDVRVRLFEIQEQWKNLVSEVAHELEWLRTAREQLAVQEEIRRVTLRIRDDVTAEYAAGMVSLTRLNEVQRDVIVAEQRLAAVGIEYALAAEDLRAVLGTNLASLSLERHVE